MRKTEMSKKSSKEVSSTMTNLSSKKMCFQSRQTTLSFLSVFILLNCDHCPQKILQKLGENVLTRAVWAGKLKGFFKIYIHHIN